MFPSQVSCSQVPLWSEGRVEVPNAHHLPQQCRANFLQPMIWNGKNHLIPSTGHLQMAGWDSHQPGEPRLKRRKAEVIGIGGKRWCLWGTSPCQQWSDPQKLPWGISLCAGAGPWPLMGEIRNVISSYCPVAETFLLCIPEHAFSTPALKHPSPPRSPPSHPPTQPHAAPLLSLHTLFLLPFLFIFCLCSVSALCFLHF